MLKQDINKLKPGRPGTKVLVKGTVRKIDGDFIEIQFSAYSLSIHYKDILLLKPTIQRPVYAPGHED
jgi:hypothetical protein